MAKKENKGKQQRLMMCKYPTDKQIQKYIKKTLKETFEGYNPDEDKYSPVENFEDQSEMYKKQTDEMMNTAYDAEQNIQSYNEAIENSEKLLKDYSHDIKKKMNMIATRDRMLQLSQDRNVYKKKIIYMLLTILIAIFITIISFYTIYNKNN
jgi:esterase/lipase